MIAGLKFVAMIAVSMSGSGGEELPARPAGLTVERTKASQLRPNSRTDLEAGSRLNAGDCLFSPLCAFRLTMQDDGNLVLYVIDDMKLPLNVLHVMSGAPDVLKLYTKPIWSTGTHVPREGRSRGRYCVLEEDGNFVIYDQDRHPVYETGTRGHPGSYLRLQSDGNLVLYTADRMPIWASNTAARSADDDVVRLQELQPGPAIHALGGRPAELSMDLRPRWRLNPGDSLHSPLGGLRLILQGDGNLVLYVIDDMRIPEDVTPILLHTEEMKDVHHNAIWQTGTNIPRQTAGTGAYCIMNDDGNFVVYDKHDHPCFQTGTSGNPGAFLRCQDDGNLVVYTRDKKAIWQSMTYSRIANR